MRHYAAFVIKISLAFIVLYFLIHTAQIKFDLLTSIAHKPLFFSCAIGMFLVMIVLSAQRWHLLNSAQGIHLGFVRTITPTYLGVAFNNLLPGAIGGDIVRSYYLFKKEPNKKSTVLISIFLDRILGFLGLVAAIALVVLSRAGQLSEQPKLFSLLLIFAIFCITVLIAFVTLMSLPQRFGVSQWLRTRYSHKRWAMSIVSLLQAMRDYQISKMIILKCLLLSVLVQLVATVILVIIAQMMGFPKISFSDYVIAIGITQIVNLIPATPGGIGIGEMAFANILLLLNPGKGAAFATIFLGYRLIGMLTYLPGVICYVPRFVLLKRKNKLQENVV